MSPFYYNKRKYGSFIASSTLHGLILLLLMLCLDKVKNLIDPLKSEDGLSNLSRSTPASVSFASSIPQISQISQNINLPKQPAKMASPLANQNIHQKKTSSIVKTTKNIIEKIKKVKKNFAQEEIKTTITQTEAVKKIEEISTSKNKIDEITEIDEKIKIQETKIEAIPEITEVIPETQEPIISKPLPSNIKQAENTKKNKITGAQLVQAFRQAYRAEQSAYSPGISDNNYSYGDDSGTSTQEYVNQRLSEWKYASYNTRVNEALSKAFRIHSSPIYFEESIYTQIIIDFILNKQGKIEEVTLVKPTGYKPLDDYIVDRIKKSQFAPIPDHLETSFYKFRHSPFVRIEKGSHTVVYSYSGNI